MRKWTKIVRSRWVGLMADRQGGVAVLTAMSLTTVMGFAGLGTETTLWYVAKRNMQGAADAAAFTAATSEEAGQNVTAFSAAANAVTAKYGFTNAAKGTLVAVNNPPKSGNYTTNAEAIEVIVSQPQSLLFAQFFLSSPPVVLARAVALATPSGSSSGGTGCVLALDQGNIAAEVTDTGTPDLDLANCSLYVNSSSSTGLKMAGGSQINALSAYIVGNYTTAGGAKLTTTQGTHTGVTPTADPYASVQVPSYSGCNQTAYNKTGTNSLGPTIPGGVYVFCSGLTVGSGSTLNLAPGTYIINQGALTVDGGATINATGGVTIILTGSGSNYSTVNIESNSHVNLTAPTTGSTAGLAFFQDRNAPQGSANNFSGGTGQNITGAIYFPNEGISYTGSTSTSGAKCTQLIALTLSFSGSSTFNSNCTGTGVKSIGGSSGSTGQVALVE